MSAKGQASLEALMWLSLAVIMALAAAVAFTDGLASAEEAKSNMELTGVLTTLFNAMDSVNEGSVRMVKVGIPAGIGDVRVSPDGYGGSGLSFTFRGANYTRSLPYRAAFSSPNPLYANGTRLLRVEKHSGTVIVSGVGDYD